MSSSFSTLRLERSADGHVVTVELSRPDALNAMNTEMGHDVLRCFDAFTWDRTARSLSSPADSVPIRRSPVAFLSRSHSGRGWRQRRVLARKLEPPRCSNGWTSRSTSAMSAEGVVRVN